MTQLFILFKHGLATKFVGPFASGDDATTFQRDEILARNPKAISAIIRQTGQRFEDCNHTGARRLDAVSAFRYGGDRISSAEFRRLCEAYPQSCPQA